MEKTKIPTSEAEWKKKLSAEEFAVLRKKNTEPPFTGTYIHHTKPGTFVCAGCGADLFSSQTKFDSGSGWPSFATPISTEAVTQKPDVSLGMKRTEVLCSRCAGHLGHVFDDGPRPTGLRYCINSIVLHFKEEKIKK